MIYTPLTTIITPNYCYYPSRQVSLVQNLPYNLVVSLLRSLRDDLVPSQVAILQHSLVTR